MSNYATIQIRDELLRLPGVGNVTFLGERDYSMRAWLNPDRMAVLGITADVVLQALSQQNLQVAAGSIGQQPVPAGQSFQLIINTLGRLTDVEQFGNVIIKIGDDTKNGSVSSVVRLRDIARVELGAQQYDQSCALDGKPSVALSIFQLPGSNALQTAQGVYGKMDELSRRFPTGLKHKIVYDTTPFIKESIIEVFKTLRDAIVLVAIVVLVFLQNWRATLIPLIAVPVAIVGTFAVMAGLGFSLNNLSLFGLVLAIGIVVDDAIVVVENVERWLAEGLSPRDAARKAMDEVTGPVIAVALVLCAVFVPCAFITGVTGQFFRQFAITIAVSTVISAFNSLTLSPALAAILLQPHGAKRDILAILLNVTLGWFFKLFNGVFSVGTTAYTNIVAVMLRVSLIVLMVYVGLLYATYWSFAHTPTGFIPAQDKGYLLLNVQLPDSASVSRTREVMKQLEAIASSIEGVEHTVSLSGQSLLLGASASNFGSMNVILKPFEDRKGLSSDSIGASISERCRREVKDAAVGVFGPPAIDGLGNAGGFKMMIEDRGPLGLAELQKTADAIVAKGNSTPGLTGLFTSSRSGTPWLQLDIDRDKCLSMGVQLGDVFSSLQIFFGSYYVNNFNEFGRSWQLNLMADSQFRYHIEDLQRIKVRNMQGQMVPLGTMINVRDGYGPVMLTRYNMYSASAVYGAPSPGTSSGESIDLMNGIADGSLPSAMSTEWSELTYLQLQAGNTAMVVFALAVVFVFLVLAAQYESWSLPLAVILVVPMCLLCSVIGVRLSGNDINIFTQIGFVVLVGLASKNAILIVEFAKQQREEGKSRREAVLEACRLRLRPILMTSFAFILGVVPLVVATGAGAEMRRTLGLAVFSGMLGVTVFGVFLTPVFFYVIQWFGDGKPAPEAVASATSDHSGHHHS
jgi:hydrophobe/amphiphile efflux-1 (HAE1) family protein